MSWLDELSLIRMAAAKYGLQWQAVAAIRRTENGGPGREFGVLSVSAPTYSDQLRICCETLVHRIAEYDTDDANAFERHEQPDGTHVLALTPDFVTWFRAIWAPSSAGNDPTNLNQFWEGNFLTNYHHFLDGHDS